jgi:hypothetical protein
LCFLKDTLVPGANNTKKWGDEMGRITKTWFFGLLVIAVLFVQDAGALSIGNDPLHDSLLDAICSIGRTPAEFDCKVYKYTSGTYADKYVYTYQISNINSDAGLSFSSAGMRDGANTFDAGYDSLIDVVTPEAWPVAVSPPGSAYALFTCPILSNGPTATSTALWSIRDRAPNPGNGRLSGTTPAVPRPATGNVFAPATEPATVVLLGTCGLVTAARQI